MNITKDFEKRCYILISIVVVLLMLPLGGPLISPWEAANLYPTLDPINYPKLIFSINEGADTSGYWGQHGYFFLRISRIVTDLFGTSLYAIRLLPVIYGVFSIILMFRVVSLEFGWRAGSIAAVLLATNIPFIVFAHSLLPQGFALMALMLLLYQYQMLVRENSNKAAVIFGLACSLLAIGYLPGRILMIVIIFFYATDDLRIFVSLIGREVTNSQVDKLKKTGIAIGSMILLLAIFYPKNIVLLFNSGFIFSKLGEYATNSADVITSLIINIQYFIKYFLLGGQHEVMMIDVVSSSLPYPIETLPVIIVSLIGFISCCFFVRTAFIRLLLIMLVVLLMALMVSTTFPDNDESNITTLSNFRVFMVVPFIIIIFSFVVDKIGTYLEAHYKISSLIMLFTIIGCVLLRIATCWGDYILYEKFLEKFSFNHDVEPSWSDHSVDKGDLQIGRRDFMDQIYYYHLSKDIGEIISLLQNDKEKKVLLISKEKYAPKYIGVSGKIPSNDPYFKELFLNYFEMFLTIYLRERGVDAAYALNTSAKNIQHDNKAIKKCNALETSGASIADANYLLVTTELFNINNCEFDDVKKINLSSYF